MGTRRIVPESNCHQIMRCINAVPTCLKKSMFNSGPFQNLVDLGLLVTKSNGLPSTPFILNKKGKEYLSLLNKNQIVTETIDSKSNRLF